MLKVMVGFRIRDKKRLKENATSCRDAGMSTVTGVYFPSRMVLLLGSCHRGRMLAASCPISNILAIQMSAVSLEIVGQDVGVIYSLPKD